MAAGWPVLGPFSLLGRILSLLYIVMAAGCPVLGFFSLLGSILSLLYTAMAAGWPLLGPFSFLGSIYIFAVHCHVSRMACTRAFLFAR